MEYYSGKHHLKRIGEILRNNTNEVCICEETDNASKTHRLLWIVKDRKLARALISVFHENDKNVPYLETFSEREAMAFVFPYEGERPLFRFLTGELLSTKEQEAVWRKLVETCMASDVPYAVLYQILRQRKLQIQSDGKITFSYALDLRGFGAEHQEADCAQECAVILLELMEVSKAGSSPLRQRLADRCAEEGYASFLELFQDVKSYSRNKRNKKLWKKFVQAFSQKKDKALGLWLWFCIILIIIAVILLLSQFIYGEIPLLRLFQNSFQTIGTENLMQ